MGKEKLGATSSSGSERGGGGLRRRSSILLRRGSHHNGGMDSTKVLEEDYVQLEELGRGRFGRRSLLVEDPRASASPDQPLRVLLRVFAKASVSKADFLREYNYSVFLAPHPNVVETYEGTYNGPTDWWFVQEWASKGSLRELLQSWPGPLPEPLVKHILEQTMSALEFLHQEGLVHRDLCTENVLLFPMPGEKETDGGMRVKLADFRLTRKVGTRASAAEDPERWSPWQAPELVEMVAKEAYSVEVGADIWALGVLIYLLCRSRYPWPRAHMTAGSYRDYKEWRKGVKHAPPKLFQRFTDRGVKMMKKALALKAKDRPPVQDLRKYLKDRWCREARSVSDDDFGPKKASRPPRQAKSQPTSPLSEGPSTPVEAKPKGLLHQWFATTLNTMSEISEQMVSAED